MKELIEAWPYLLAFVVITAPAVYGLWRWNQMIARVIDQLEARDRRYAERAKVDMKEEAP